MKPKVFVTRRVPQPALDLLAGHAEVNVNPAQDRVLSKQELTRAVKDHDLLFCTLNDTIDADVLNANPGLRIVAVMAVGYNNVDLATATARRIPVTNTPGVLTETTADLAWALILAVARRIVEADKFTRSGRFTNWGPMLMLGTDVHRKTLGIVGMGRIGQAVARRACGFDMKVLYHTRSRLASEVEAQLGVEYRALDALLRESDFVSIHTPLTPSTHHLIGARELGIMKRTAYLINTSRGPVVDERALVDALLRERIAGAGLDVYENEPALESELVGLDNVVLLPHIGSASLETRTRMALTTADNIIAVINGERPPNVVNPEVYQSHTIE